MGKSHEFQEPLDASILSKGPMKKWEDYVVAPVGEIRDCCDLNSPWALAPEERMGGFWREHLARAIDNHWDDLEGGPCSFEDGPGGGE